MEPNKTTSAMQFGQWAAKIRPNKDGFTCHRQTRLWDNTNFQEKQGNRE